jgi:hypothetical protein
MPPRLAGILFIIATALLFWGAVLYIGGHY